MPSVAELDAVSPVQAAEMLRSCCGASRWVSAMVARRPFGSLDAVLATAHAVWRTLTPADWQEAFRHHPRIGEKVSARPQTERAQGWSAREQAGVRYADAATREALAQMNREYELHFGWTYIVNATGKSAEQMLTLARQRLTNSPEAELGVAAGEHEQIMLHRLDKLLLDERHGGIAP